MRSSSTEPGPARAGAWVRLALVAVLVAGAVAGPLIDRTGAIYTDVEIVEITVLAPTATPGPTESSEPTESPEPTETPTPTPSATEPESGPEGLRVGSSAPPTPEPTPTETAGRGKVVDPLPGLPTPPTR